jgi:DnaJ-class molecular chaperone
MAIDPYKILGVDKTATQDEIQKAYRKLAKKIHPDLNPGNKKAEEQFKEVASAYTLLSDETKRKQFDAGEIDGLGAGKPRQNYYRDYADAGTANPYTHNAGFGDDDDFFSELFRRQGGRGGDGEFKMRGQDARYQLTLDFLGAVNGGKQSLTLPDGSHLEVNIPPGCRDGQTLRLRGKGQLGRGGGTAGDALIEIKVAPHKFFQRVGDDIRIDMPITLKEAVLGAKIKVPTTAGSVTMTVPKGANTGTVLRLKGQGVARANGNHGDQLITLKIMLPTATDQSLEKFISEWRPATEQNPRESMGV